MINEQLNTQVVEAEKTLLSLYHQMYGGGGSPFRQFKSFLLSGPRGRDGRLIIASFKPDIVTQGKETGANEGNETPVQQLPQPPKPAASLKQQGEQSQSDGAGAAEGRFDVLKDDIEKMSLTAVASKYEKAELIAYAESIGVAIADTMNEKQIVKAISKANESKG